MSLKDLINEKITKEQAMNLTKLEGSALMELFNISNLTREKYCGNDLSYCTITNAKSGKCSENCRFCTQSSHYKTDTPIYNIKEIDILMNEYKNAIKIGSHQFGFVSSGKTILQNKNDFEHLKKFVIEASNTKKDIEICASVGLMDKDSLLELKKLGLTRLHHNLQTSKTAYSNLVATTHTYDEKIETIKKAKEIGLNVCAGGIIGMGESWEDRIDMALLLRDLDVDSVPLNILNPIKGTPMGDRPLLKSKDFLKTIAIYRIILKNKTIKVAAGRENILKDFMGMAFLCGANALFVGGYLTKAGRSIDDDFKFIQEVKEIWNKSIYDL